MTVRIKEWLSGGELALENTKPDEPPANFSLGTMMSGQARDWLPTGAFTLDAVRASLAPWIAHWSDRWFLNVKAEIGSVRPSKQNSRSAHSLTLRGATTEAVLSGPGKRSLLEAALNTDLSGAVLAVSDHEILNSFASEAVKDLLAIVDNALGDECDRDSPKLSVVILVGGGETIEMIVPSSSLVQAIKRTVPSTQNLRKATPRIEALKPVKLVAEGLLGRADLTLDDLRNLSIGDVVVLDVALESPVELRLRGTRKRIARGKMMRTNGRVSIQL